MRKIIRKKSKKTHAVGRELSLTIERFAHDGRGLAFVDNKVILVADALPKEQVQVKTVAENRNQIEARVLKRLSESNHRQSPQCEYYSQCGGCDLQHLTFERQQQFKLDQFKWLFRQLLPKSKAIEPMIHSPPFAYRHRIRLQVHQGDVGFFQRQSKQIIPIKQCIIATAKINALLEQLLAAGTLAALKQLEAIELLQDDLGNLALRLMATSSISELKQQQISTACQAFSLERVQFEWPKQTIVASKPLCNQWKNLTFEYLPGQFTQVNSQVNQLMLQQAIDWLHQAKAIDQDSVCLDLFCGMGNFSLPLAQICGKVMAMEASQASIDCAKKNAKLNELSHCQFIKQDLFVKNWYQPLGQQQFDLLVLDPPRAGCEQVCRDIAQIKADWILYVSCQPSTLKRDADILVQSGYQVEQANIMDMFAQSHHAECMMLFRRKKKS